MTDEDSNSGSSTWSFTTQILLSSMLLPDAVVRSGPVLLRFPSVVSLADISSSLSRVLSSSGPRCMNSS